MVIDSPLVYIQQDFISLNEYYEKQDVSIESIKRRMFVSLRNCNYHIADHYYTLNSHNVFSQFDSFKDLFTIVLPSFSEVFLKHDNQSNLVYVKEHQFVEWQNIIAEVSPLLLISCYIFKNKKFLNNLSEIQNDLFENFILPNTRNTALIKPNIIQLNSLLEENNGFNDLHIHLNGVIESDAVWENILYDTNSSLKIFRQNKDKESFHQEFEQLGVSFNVIDIFNLIKRAKQIREILFNKCFSTNRDNYLSYLHPFSAIYTDSKNIENPCELIRYESLMYVLVLNTISLHDNENLAKLLHEYLLIKGFFNKLLVHSKSKYGFEQFQNITKNDIRESADKNHYSKLVQLSGNTFTNFKNIELRFSPKDSITKLCKLTKDIDNAWNFFLKNSNHDKKNEYYLISHFIKTKANKTYNYKNLRTELEKKAKILVTYKNNNPTTNKIKGIDAAASEFDTPPEIFAPIYRYLRANGFKHFTFHAGEDFYHVLSGLRAIFESIIFCDLQNGDRIGHACAAGIDIKIWYERLNGNLYMPFGEYIDDLVFVYDFIISRKIESIYSLLPRLAEKISSGYFKIFNLNMQISEIITAWKLREYNPDSSKISNSSSSIKQLIQKYNNMQFIEKYKNSIQIKIDEDISLEQMNLVQKELLKFMHEREIIIETLPTSNLRIGWHDNFDTYQLFNWYKWEKKGYPIPPIVLGTDDPGIFQTNIFNEFALIFCYMVYDMKISRNEAMDFIYKLIQNSELYIFK